MFTSMNLRFLHLSLLTGTLLIFAGCATPTTVDYDRSAASRFGDYQCFVIDARETRSNYQDIVLSPIVDRRIEGALARELAAKGFGQECANPDFRVTFNTTTKIKTEINDLGVGPTPFRRRPYFGYSGYSHLDVDEYEEGTFIVDIIDNESKHLVWRGAYKQRLGWSAPTESDVQKIIASVLEKFPPETTNAK